MKIEKIAKKLEFLEGSYRFPELQIHPDLTGEVVHGCSVEKTLFKFSNLEELSQKLDQEIAKLKSKEIEFTGQLCREWAKANPDEIVGFTDYNNKGELATQWVYMVDKLPKYYYLDKSKEGLEQLHSARPLKDVVLEWARNREG